MGAIKKKRIPYVRNACVNCKEIHKKCCATRPCMNCSELKIDCIQPGPRKRRTKPVIPQPIDVNILLDIELEILKQLMAE